MHWTELSDNNFHQFLDEWPNRDVLPRAQSPNINLWLPLAQSPNVNLWRAPSVNLFSKANMARGARAARMAKLAEKRRASRERALERRMLADASRERALVRRMLADARAANTRGARASRMAKLAEKRDPRAAADKNAQIARALDNFGALLSPPKTPAPKKSRKRVVKKKVKTPVQQPQPEPSSAANSRRRVVEALSAVKNRRLTPREIWILQYANHFVKHGYPSYWGIPS